MKEYKYIVYLNGIVWDDVTAPNIRLAKRRANALIRRDSKLYNMNPNAPKVVTLETLKTFLGR